MATFDYIKTRGIADKLIAKFGRQASLKRGLDLRPCTLVEVDYSPQERDGQLIQFTDRRVLVAAGGLTVPPDPEQDRLVLDGVELRIVTSRPLRPADVALFYELQVRR